MIKKITLIVMISSLIMTSEGKWFTSKNTSFGLGDEKFGLDLFSLSRTIYEKDNDEFFIGFGTMIMITHFGAGWKRYYETDKKLKPFSCVSIFSRLANKMGVTNGSSVREDDCIGLSGGVSLMLWNRKEEKRDLYLNIGAISIYDFRNEVMGYPFINIEFKN